MTKSHARCAPRSDRRIARRWRTRDETMRAHGGDRMGEEADWMDPHREDPPFAIA
jgi:hypothetical protein